MKNKGFLLIELLLVALIIAILASIILPRYTNTMKQVKSTEMNTAVETAKKNAALYGGGSAQMGMRGTIDLNKIQQQLNGQGHIPPVNKHTSTYSTTNKKKSSDSDEGSIMIRFED